MRSTRFLILSEQNPKTFPLTVKIHHAMDFKLQPVRRPVDVGFLPEERESVFWHHLFMSSCGLPLRSLFQYKGVLVALAISVTVCY